MKKTILTVMFITGVINISNSQSSIDDIYNCVNGHYDNLNICFTSNDVTGIFRGTGTTLYFQPDAGVQYNQFSTCVDNYNKDRLTCPVAPLLVVGTSTKTKKTISQ